MFEDDTLPAVFLATFLVAYIIYQLNRAKEKASDSRYPPCFTSLPIVGSLPFLKRGMNVLPKQLMEISRKLGPVFSIYSGRNLVVVLNGKKAVGDALLRQSEAFADRPKFFAEANMLNFTRAGIAFAPYTEDYKRNHKQSLSILKEFGFGVIQESDNRSLHEVEQLIQNLQSENGRNFNPRPLIVFYTANVSMRILFGPYFQSVETDLNKIIRGAHEWVDNDDPTYDVIPFVRFLPYYRKKFDNMRRAQVALREGIEEAIRHSKTSADACFVNRYLEIHGPEYDHMNLFYIVRDLCGGSSHTMAVTLLWSIVEMANNPDVQTKVQQEIDEVIPSGRFPTYGDRPNLPYTEVTIMESQRLHTQSPFTIPHATSKDVQLHGYFIPQGCRIIPNLYSVHMDPEIWTDPETFRPERFLDEEGKITGKENVIPFGVGKRSCIGEMLGRQVIFVFLTNILQKFRILPPEGQNSVSVSAQSGIVVGPSAYEVRFIPRNNQETVYHESRFSSD